MDNVDWNFNFFILFLLASYFDWLAIPILTIPYSLNKAEAYNKVFVSSLMIYFIILISIFEYQNLIAVPISLIIANLFTYVYSYIKLNKILFLKKSFI